jgi:peptide/nickel transport system substrate-binding protein
VPQYAQLIKAQCQPAGINVTIAPISYNDYYAGNPAPWLSVPMGITDWAPRPTPIQFVQAILLTTSVWNGSHWSSPAYDKLAAAYSATLDQTSRLKVATQMAQTEQDETPHVLSFFITQLSARVKNLYNVQGINLYLDLTKAYLA